MTEQLVMKEQVIMTPKAKTANSTIILIERKTLETTDESMHVAGGQHAGLIINKKALAENEQNGEIPADLSLEFRVFLVSAQTGKHTQEDRILRFWFRPCPLTMQRPNDSRQATLAQDFFRELVSPKEFPRDYVGFIKKIMKQLQHGYVEIGQVEVELRLRQDAPPPSRPLSSDDSSLGQVTLLTVEKVLDIIEAAYPNPITIKDVASGHGWDPEEVAEHMAALQSRGLVNAIPHPSGGAFTRQQSRDQQVTVVKQMPALADARQPTIAIVTAQYCEKLAVDAMLECKETFVRYTTVGESNVYTLGQLGSHRVVCSKLPRVGHTREAMTAAGNTTTRLLGTFQRVDYVFLVGVGGAVPHYTDYGRHVRLGDVVVSCPSNNKHVYLYCDNAKETPEGYDFEVKSYSPNNMNLQEIATKLKQVSEKDPSSCPWPSHIDQGLSVLASHADTDFSRPSDDTDRLFMSIGDGDVIQVEHPQPLGGGVKNGTPKRPRVHLGPIASGRQVVKDDRLRQQFATHTGALAYDCEFDAVIESILGNCKDSFVCIRGISDYKDGTRRKEWQPYAALAAAAVMKAIVCALPAPGV